MHTKLAAALAVMALLGGCAKKDSDTGALRDDRAGVDTVVKAGTIKDTTVIKADTNIDVDTLKKTDHIEKKKN
jgi:type IV pilus biogenesis protein CpaD/CtpE